MFHVIWGYSGLQLNNFISSLCFGEKFEDCISTSHSSSNFAIFFPTTCSSAAVVHAFQPSLPLFFCIVTCWDQGQVLVWKIDGYSIEPRNSITWHYKSMAGNWKSGQGSKGKPVLYGVQKQKAVLVWCKAWICHDSSYQWLKKMAKITSHIFSVAVQSLYDMPPDETEPPWLQAWLEPENWISYPHL